MNLVLSEEQQLLQHTARDFVTKSASLRRLRALRDSGDELGYSRDVWKEMVKLGWPGIIFPEECGGLAMGYADLAVVLEELGRGLMPEPFLSSVLLGGTALQLGGSPALSQALLSQLINGEVVVAFAYQERDSRYDLHHVSMQAEREGSGWRITGEKLHVLDGYGSDRLIVSARTAGGVGDRDGITLFLLHAQGSGVHISREWRIDSRNAAMVRLDRVKATDVQVLGEVGKGADLLETVIDRATIGLCAEMLGSMTAALEMTLAYLKTRQQFGVVIGTFQALKHRAAKLYIETELARSAVMAAHQAIDAGSNDVAQYASLAKARCSDAFVLIANEAVQMHGGIGMTDEHDAGFFIKRARVAEITFGDAAYHRNRYAELHQY